MAQWKCELRVSWYAQIVALVTYGILMLLVLISPWPEGYGPIWLLLLILLVFECISSQRRIHARCGELVLLADNQVRWQKQDWRLLKKPWILRMGMLLTLQPIEPEKRVQRLWVAADSMQNADWRRLNQILKYQSQPGQDQEPQ